MRWRATLAVGAVALGFGALLAAACGSSGTAPTPTPSFNQIRSKLPRDAHPSVSDADYRTLIDDNTRFAFDLYSRLQDKQNLVFSPLSASVALAMVYAGAKGETATQMAAALHFELPQAALHPAFDRLELELASRSHAGHEAGDPGSVDLKLVNALWAQQGLSIVPSFLDTLAVDYGAGVDELDFAGNPDGAVNVINQWASDQTAGKITGLLRQGDITPRTKMVLADALYFKANWASTFDDSATAPATFHTLASGDVSVPTMHQTASFGYAEGNGYQVLDLPYDGGALSMRIVLPAAGRFAEIRGSLSLAWMQSVDQSIGWPSVVVSLPKFKFDWGTKSLAPALEALGMTDAFTPSADFTGMVKEPRLHIDGVLQKAYIGVDESGTEAAAVTVVAMVPGADAGGPIPHKQFDVDRPFIFFIRDQNGTLLFVGQVTDPS